jgi:hypothetical protein
MLRTVAHSATPYWLALAGIAGVLALAITVSLWAHYGTVVFFETIRAGFVACFG